MPAPPSACTGGENAERNVLVGRLASVMQNYNGWLNRMVLFTGWNFSISQAINPLPADRFGATAFRAPDHVGRRLPVGERLRRDPRFACRFFRLAYDQFCELSSSGHPATNSTCASIPGTRC